VVTAQVELLSVEVPTEMSFLFRWHMLVFRRSANPHARLSVGPRSPFRLSLQLPYVPWRPNFSLPAAIVVFYLPPAGAVNSVVAWLPQFQRAACLWSLRPFGGDRLPQNVLALVFWGLASRSTACSSRVCLRASFTGFSPPSIRDLLPHQRTPYMPATPYIALG
jgi:hypothetical protein